MTEITSNHDEHFAFLADGGEESLGESFSESDMSEEIEAEHTIKDGSLQLDNHEVLEESEEDDDDDDDVDDDDDGGVQLFSALAI